MYFLPLAILIGYIIIDSIIVKQHRNKIKYVIHVNGTRGKSSIVRMLDAVFREHGYLTFSKVTGTVPKYRDIFGIEYDLNRKRVSVLEQKKILKYASKQGSDVLIVECMALKKDMQIVSERILNADFAIISNARLDHLEVMGKSHDEIMGTLFSMTREGQKIILGDTKLSDYADRHGINAQITKQFQNIPGEFQANTNICFEISERLGLDQNTTARAISNYKADCGRSRLIYYKENKVYFGFAINDLESTIEYYNRYKNDKRCIIWLNDRMDRPIRSLMFLNWISEVKPERVILSGDCIKFNMKRLRNLGFQGEIYHIKDFNETGVNIIGIGNIKNLDLILGDFNV